MNKYKLPLLIIAFVAFSINSSAQSPDRNTGIEFFNQRNYPAAVASLKKAVKIDARDTVAMYYLGLAYLRSEKYGEAVKVLEKSTALDPNDAKAKTALALAYLYKNSTKAAPTAAEALKLNPRNADANYILGTTKLRQELYDAAYENASKAIETDPKHAPAYLLRSQALVSSFARQKGTITKPKSAVNQLLYEATDDLQKFVDLVPDHEEIAYHREYLNSLKFFSEFYRGVEAREGIDPENRSSPSANTTQLKILSKPRASYTDAARSAGVSGTIRLLVGLSADGQVKHILVLKALGYGLDQQAVTAARKIKYQPKTVDGKPVPSVVTFDYGFKIL